MRAPGEGAAMASVTSSMSSVDSVADSVGGDVLGARRGRNEISIPRELYDEQHRTGEAVWRERRARGRGREGTSALTPRLQRAPVRLPPHRNAALLAAAAKYDDDGPPVAAPPPRLAPEAPVYNDGTPPRTAGGVGGGDGDDASGGGYESLVGSTAPSSPATAPPGSPRGVGDGPPPPPRTPPARVKRDLEGHVTVMHLSNPGKLMLVSPERAARSSTPPPPGNRRPKFKQNSPDVTPPRKGGGAMPLDRGGSPVYDFDSPRPVVDGVAADAGGAGAATPPRTYRHVYQLLPPLIRSPSKQREREESPLTTPANARPRASPGDPHYSPRTRTPPPKKKRVAFDIDMPEDHPAFSFVVSPRFGTRSPDFSPKIKPKAEKHLTWFPPSPETFEGSPEGRLMQTSWSMSPVRRKGGFAAGYPEAWRDGAGSPMKNTYDDTRVQEALASREWEAHRDPDTGRRYYVHIGSNLSVWDLAEELERRHEQMQSEAVQDALDSGIWRMAVDPATSGVYYYHPETGRTCWELGDDAVYEAEKEVDRLEAEEAQARAELDAAAAAEASSDDAGSVGTRRSSSPRSPRAPVLSPPRRPQSLTKMILARDLAAMPAHPSYERMTLAIPESDTLDFPLLGLPGGADRDDAATQPVSPRTPRTPAANGPTPFPRLGSGRADTARVPGPIPKDSPAWSMSPEDKKLRWKADPFAGAEWVDGDALESPEGVDPVPEDVEKRKRILADMAAGDREREKMWKVPKPEFDKLPPSEAADEDWKHADPTGVADLRHEAAEQQELQDQCEFKPSVTKNINKKAYNAHDKWGGMTFLTDDLKAGVEENEKRKAMLEERNKKLQDALDEHEKVKASMVPLPAPEKPIARSPPPPKVEHPYGMSPPTAAVAYTDDDPDYEAHPELHPLYPYHVDAHGSIREVPRDPRSRKARPPPQPPLRVRDMPRPTSIPPRPGMPGRTRGAAPSMADALPDLPFLSPVRAVRLVPEGGADRFRLEPSGEMLTRTAV